MTQNRFRSSRSADARARKPASPRTGTGLRASSRRASTNKSCWTSSWASFGPLGVLDEKALAIRYAAGAFGGCVRALGRLALEGLVMRRPRVGTVVAPLDIREIEQAFQVRHMLEARTAALAAQKASDDGHRPRSLGAFDGAEGGDRKQGISAPWLAMDRVFHRAIATATQNPVLGRYVISLQNIATRFWVYAMEKAVAGRTAGGRAAASPPRRRHR